MFKSKKQEILTYVIAGIYLLLLIWLILFKFSVDFNSLSYIRNINLIPFKESLIINGRISIKEIVYNVLVFVPLGVYVNIIKPDWAIWKKFLPAFIVSLLLETIQFILAIGASDITDLLGNTLGGVLGVGLLFVFRQIFKNQYINIINTIGLIIELFGLGLLVILILSNISSVSYTTTDSEVVLVDEGPANHNNEPGILRTIDIELTNDNSPEHVTLQAFLIAGEEYRDKAFSEALLSNGAYGVQVIIKDGTNDTTLYDRNFSIDRIGQGQLGLVTDGSRWYILENCCNEQMGEGSYYYEVFYWNNTEKVIADESHVNFALDMDSALRYANRGEEIICREDVIPQYRENIEKWYKGSELLVACDVSSYYYNTKNAYIVTDTNQQKYTLEDYFSHIWDRKSEYEANILKDALQQATNYGVY